MKNKLILGAFAMSFMVVSCSSDSIDTSGDEEKSEEVTAETAAKVKAAEDLQSDAIVLDAELDEYIKSH